MPESTVSLLLRKGGLQSGQHTFLPSISPSLFCSSHTSNHPVYRGLLGKAGVINYSLHLYGPQIIKCPSLSHRFNIPIGSSLRLMSISKQAWENKSSSITYYTSYHISQAFSSNTRVMSPMSCCSCQRKIKGCKSVAKKLNRSK